MTVRFNAFQHPKQVNVNVGLSSFMGWCGVKAWRWEWQLNVYFTV